MNLIGFRQVRNGPGDFQDFVIGAGGELELVEGAGQESGGLLRQWAGRGEILVTQCGVAAQAESDEPLALATPRTHDPGLDRRGGFRPTRRRQGVDGEGRNVDVEVDPVQQRPGDLRQVGGHLR